MTLTFDNNTPRAKVKVNQQNEKILPPQLSLSPLIASFLALIFPRDKKGGLWGWGVMIQLEKSETLDRQIRVREKICSRANLRYRGMKRDKDGQK